MGGSNKIQVWGADLAGNEGLASIDYINNPYGIEVPPAPLIWTLPEAVNGDLDIVGLIDRYVMTGTNTTIVSRNDTLFNYSTWDDAIFSGAESIGSAILAQSAGIGDNYIVINGSDANLFKNNSLYVGITNEDMTWWDYYLITGNDSGVAPND